MTQLTSQIKRKAGRPPTNYASVPPNEPQTVTTKETPMSRSFINITTPHRKGVRLDLNDISEYAKAGQEVNDIQIILKNGRASIYRFGTEKDAYEFLDLLDSRLL